MIGTLIRVVVFGLMLVGACGNALALSIIFPPNTIYFPRYGDVVAPQAHIVIGRGHEDSAIMGLEANKALKDNVILTNDYEEIIPLVATDGGLRPLSPFLEGRYKIRYFEPGEEPEISRFRVSKEVTVSPPREPIDFHWNLKAFERPLGYVDGVCQRLVWWTTCSQYFVAARFKTLPLEPDQLFAYYEIGFLDQSKEQSDGYYLLIRTKGLIQTRGRPEFNQRWGLGSPVDQCMAVMVYDGYGQKRGPYYSCRPRKYIQGSEEELAKGESHVEDWDKIEDWDYDD